MGAVEVVQVVAAEPDVHWADPNFELSCSVHPQRLQALAARGFNTAASAASRPSVTPGFPFHVELVTPSETLKVLCHHVREVLGVLSLRKADPYVERAITRT